MRKRHSGWTTMRMSCVWRCSWLMGSLKPWSKILSMCWTTSVRNRGECCLCDILQINRTLSANVSPGPFCLLIPHLHPSKSASGPCTCPWGLLAWRSRDSAVEQVVQPLPLETVHCTGWFFLVGRVARLVWRCSVVLRLSLAPVPGLQRGLTPCVLTLEDHLSLKPGQRDAWINAS